MRWIGFALLFLIAPACTTSAPQRDEKPEVIAEFRWLVARKSAQIDSVRLHAQLLDSFSQTAGAEGTVMAKIGWGMYYKQKGYYRQALTSYAQGAAISLPPPADSLTARALTGAGICYAQSGNADLATDHFLKALRIFERLHDTENAAGAHTSLAQVYQVADNAPQARSHLQQAMQILGGQKKSRSYAIAAHTLANLHGMSGHIDSALAIDNELLALLSETGSSGLRSSFYDNKAHCYMVTKQFDSSYFYFRKSIVIDSINGDAKQATDSYLGLGSLFLEQKDYVRAEQSLQEFLKRARAINYRQSEKEAWGLLADIAIATGQPEKALAAKDSLRKASEYQLNDKTKTRIAELETIYNTEKKDKQLADAHEVLVLQRYIIGGVVLLLVALLLLGFSYYARYRRRKDDELQTVLRQQQELATQALFEREQQERLRIGRDLHDSIGQRLSVVKMQLSSLAGTGSEATLQLVDQALREVRTISHNLIPEALNFGLVRAIEELCEQIAQTGTAAPFTCAETLPKPLLQPAAELALYRMVQEITGNMVRHAEAKTISIDLTATANELHLHITDDGKGFDPKRLAESDGRGWGNVHARVMLLKGFMELQSAPGAGTKVYLRLPR